MDWLFGLPLELRLAAIFAFGLILGGQLNRGIYRLAWSPRAIGPWSPPLPQAPARRWYDRIPVWGWLTLRRESALHGRSFWLRPALIELASGLGLAALYYFEVVQAALFPAAGLRPDPAALHAQYFCHVVLISLMAVATFIDFDEQTIPDEITVPGTVVGLVLAALLPLARPWVLVPTDYPRWGWMVDHLHLTTPLDWPGWLDQGWGLACGLAAFAGWWLSDPAVDVDFEARVVQGRALPACQPRAAHLGGARGDWQCWVRRPSPLSGCSGVIAGRACSRHSSAWRSAVRWCGRYGSSAPWRCGRKRWASAT